MDHDEVIMAVAREVSQLTATLNAEREDRRRRDDEAREVREKIFTIIGDLRKDMSAQANAVAIAQGDIKRMKPVVETISSTRYKIIGAITILGLILSIFGGAIKDAILATKDAFVMVMRDNPKT